MIEPPERLPERDQAIAAMLPNIPFDGWTWDEYESAMKKIAALPPTERGPAAAVVGVPLLLAPTFGDSQRLVRGTRERDTTRE